MSTENWKLEKDLCRCCHAEGSFHNLSEPRHHLGQLEVYSDMIQQSLNIELTPVTGLLCAMTFTICDSCIMRLRDATNFRRQVLLCEERFKDMYSSVLKALTPSFAVKEESPPPLPGIKVEIEPIDDDDDVFDSRFDDDNDDDDNKTMLELKLEGQDAKKAKGKGKAKPAKQKAKKAAKKTIKKKKQEEDAEVVVLPKGDEALPKKGVKRVPPKFVLQDADYRKDGEEYTCAHCDKKYYKIFSLRFHVKTKHYKIARYFCPYCRKEFMTPAPLTVHKLEEHNVDDRFKCKACSSQFNTKVQLRKHINNFHMLGEKYKCEFCDYESFSFEGMYKHKFKHRTVKNYHCKFCRKSFLRKATLDLHERIHTGDRRKVCKVCGQAFVQKASLNYHMTKYHPEVNF